MPDHQGPALRPTAPSDLGPDPEARPRSNPTRKELVHLWRNRDLLMQFAFNDLKHRYIGSSIGIFWMVINPIVELVTYTFVFGVLMSVRYSPSGGVAQYALFLFCGMIAWFHVQESLTRATTSITENAHLIKKVNFPAAILPGHVVISALFNQAVRTLILALGVIFLGGGLSGWFLMVPFFMLVQTLMVMGMAFFLATAQVYFRDTAHWVNAVLLAWMFMTPIFYPPSAYPKQLNILLQVNPLAHTVGILQALILNQRLPSAGAIVVAIAAAAFFFIAGFSVFAHHRKTFADLA